MRIDFPRVPYPKHAETFWELIALGGELRRMQLLESPKVEQFITKFPAGGDNVVEKITFTTGARPSRLHVDAGQRPAVQSSEGDVYFNATQYFEGVAMRRRKFKCRYF